jgi:hypothetical protein
MDKKGRNIWFANYQINGLLLIVLIILIILLVRPIFLAEQNIEPIVQGPGVTKVVKLSNYFDGLKETPGDTDVYILEGEKPGGQILVFGGTHPTEPAGLLTAVLLIENVKVESGKLIVIPRANASGFTWTEPGLGHPDKFYIKTDEGYRWFRFGARGTNPIHQWPDPELYTHYPSGQSLSADEVRNLNRCFPGRPDGLLTEKVGYGITELIRKEKIDVAVDLHEAPPEKPLINAIVAHEKASELSILTALNLEMRDIKLRLESSPVALRGLSHREIGDHTDAMSVLLEVPNPAQGMIRGKTDADLVVLGQDWHYVRAAKLGRLFVTFDEKGWPIEVRVARHITTIFELTNAFTELYPDKPIKLNNVPDYDLLIKYGVGHFLKPVSD